MGTVSISEYFKVSKENNQSDDILDNQPQDVVDKTEEEISTNTVSKKELDGQELEPNLNIEFNTIEDAPDTDKELEGETEVYVEKVSQESDIISKDLQEKSKYLNRLQEEAVALESEIPLQMKLLENPEVIKSADVMLATESLKYKLKLLDIPVTNSKALNMISIESINKYPASDLQITVEDEKTLLAKIKDTIKKLWEWIKNIIKKGIDFIKNIKTNIFKKKIEENIKNTESKLQELKALGKDVSILELNINSDDSKLHILTIYSLLGNSVSDYLSKRNNLYSKLSNSGFLKNLETVIFPEIDKLNKEVLSTTGQITAFDIDFNSIYILDITKDTIQVVDRKNINTVKTINKTKPVKSITLNIAKAINAIKLDINVIDSVKDDAIKIIENQLKIADILKTKADQANDPETAKALQDELKTLTDLINSNISNPSKFLQTLINGTDIIDVELVNKK